jgi:putative respose regulatory protein
VKSARVALGWPRLRRANGVDDVAAGVVGPAGCAGGPQNPGDGVAAAAASSAAGLGDGSGPGTSSATGAVAPKTGTSAPKAGMTAVAPKTDTTGPRQRLTQALARGATLTRAAQEAGVSPQLAAVMVEQLRRSGSLLGATSLCASGLGACHSLEVDENTAIRCAGCPLSLKRTI